MVPLKGHGDTKKYEIGKKIKCQYFSVLSHKHLRSRETLRSLAKRAGEHKCFVSERKVSQRDKHFVSKCKVPQGNAKF